MSSQPGSFDWKQLDERTANGLLLEISLEMRVLIEAEERQIDFANLRNENDLAAPSLRLAMHLRRTDEWIQRAYDAYCDVWRRQGNPVTADFLRAMCANGIRTIVSARTGAILGELAMLAGRTGKFSEMWLKSVSESFRRDMELLFGKWQRRVEIEARSLELIPSPSNVGSIATQQEIHQARERIRHFEAEISAVETKIGAFQQSLTEAIVRGTSTIQPRDIDKVIRKLHADKKELEFRRDDWQISLNSALNRLAGERKQDKLEENAPQQPATLTTFRTHIEFPAKEPAVLESANGEAQSRVVPKIKYSSGIKRAIALLLSITPDASALRICRQFDEDGILELPESWTTGDNRSFERAYKDPKHRPKIEKMISKVKTEMRKKGLLG